MSIVGDFVEQVTKTILNEGLRKIDEIPYDFQRRRLTIVVAEEGGGEGTHRIVTKGAFDNVLAACAQVRAGEQARALDDAERRRLAACTSAQRRRGRYRGDDRPCPPGRRHHAPHRHPQAPLPALRAGVAAPRGRCRR